VPLLGAVENMAFVTCPGCGERTLLHAPAPADRTIWALGVERLATVPHRADAVVTGEDIGPVAAAVRRHLDRPDRNPAHP
jgi:ATP-binding protein involved in chromosome partitioning